MATNLSKLNNDQLAAALRAGYNMAPRRLHKQPRGLLINCVRQALNSRKYASRMQQALSTVDKGS